MQLILIRHSITAGISKSATSADEPTNRFCPEGVALAQKCCAFSSISTGHSLLQPYEALHRNGRNSLFQDAAPASKTLPNVISAHSRKNYRNCPAFRRIRHGLTVAERCRFRRSRKPPYRTLLCCRAANRAAKRFQTAAIVAHGGTCMAILSQMEQQHIPYFDWHIPFCEPICCEIVSLSPLQLKLCNEKSG